MRSANPGTHLGCRSLLQKAVRRGHPDIVTRVVHHLEAVGDFNWLKGRAGVIIAEECWPLLGSWRLPTAGRKGPLPERRRHQRDALVSALIDTSSNRKSKDAAGLGTLAYSLSEGDESVLSGRSTDVHVKRIATGISDPKAFWTDLSHDATGEVFCFVENSHSAYRKAGWPWDRAFIQAAAYLAVLADALPEPIQVDEPAVDRDFPFHVALDKHTPQGKFALRTLSKDIGVSYRQLNWVSFYCESALVNDRSPSPWWKMEVTWRLGKVGLSPHQASQLWEIARPKFQQLLEQEAADLEQHIGDTECPEYSHADIFSSMEDR